MLGNVNRCYDQKQFFATSKMQKTSKMQCTSFVMFMFANVFYNLIKTRKIENLIFFFEPIDYLTLYFI